MFTRLSKKIGFTETELKIVLFLTLTLLAGFSYKSFFTESQANEKIMAFDYSKEDSLFLNASTIIQMDSISLKNDKEVDLKQEVLNFNTRSFKKSKTKSLPAEKSINLNSAVLSDLVRLPGIGEKTAIKILELRTKQGGFKKVEDLIKVKGIGETKLNNIKKYLYIE